jgi:hypothetical protein
MLKKKHLIDSIWTRVKLYCIHNYKNIAQIKRKTEEATAISKLYSKYAMQINKTDNDKIVA